MNIKIYFTNERTLPILQHLNLHVWQSTNNSGFAGESTLQIHRTVLVSRFLLSPLGRASSGTRGPCSSIRPLRSGNCLSFSEFASLCLDTHQVQADRSLCPSSFGPSFVRSCREDRSFRNSTGIRMRTQRNIDLPMSTPFLTLHFSNSIANIPSK